MAFSDISVVIPVYNEEGNLEPLLGELRATLDPLAPGWELVFVDDGSDDQSPRILDRMALSSDRIRVLRLPRNTGKSAALEAGFRRASGRVVVTLDADLQNDPADIPRLLDALAHADVAAGVRRRRHDSLSRRLASRVGNALRRLALRDGSSDSACGLRAYRRETLARIPMFHGMHRFMPVLARLAGARVREVTVHHRPRASGRAKYGLRNRLRSALDLLAVLWMRRRWIDLTGVVESRSPRADPPGRDKPR